MGGKKRKRKEDSNSRFSCHLKEKRGTPASATKHLSHTPNSNICFCSINCFHMGETHHTWLYSFQKSAFKVLSTPRPAWCLLLSYHQADTDRLAEIAQSDSLRGSCPRGNEEMCWATEQYRQWTHHWVLAGKDLWWDKRIKHNSVIVPLNTAAVPEWYRAPTRVSTCALPEQWDRSLHR